MSFISISYFWFLNANAFPITIPFIWKFLNFTDENYFSRWKVTPNAWSVSSLHFQFRVAPFCAQFALIIEFNLHHKIVLFENGRSVCTISAVLRFKRNGHRKIIALGNGGWKYEAENIETNYLSNGEFDTFCLSVTALNGSTNYSLKET